MKVWGKIIERVHAVLVARSTYGAFGRFDYRPGVRSQTLMRCLISQISSLVLLHALLFPQFTQLELANIFVYMERKKNFSKV